MVFDKTILGVQIIYLLGVTNIIGILLVFFSCRCLAGRRITNRLMQHGSYRKFYKNHCYYWWIFFGSVLLHTIIAFLVFGFPF